MHVKVRWAKNLTRQRTCGAKVRQVSPTFSSCGETTDWRFQLSEILQKIRSAWWKLAMLIWLGMSWIVEEQIFKEFVSERHTLFQQCFQSWERSAYGWLKSFTNLFIAQWFSDTQGQGGRGQIINPCRTLPPTQLQYSSCLAQLHG